MLNAVSTHHLCLVSQLLLLHLQCHCVGPIVVAIVLRSIDVVEGILTVAVPIKEAAIEIELVNWNLRHSSYNFALECNYVSFSDGILWSIGSEPCTSGFV